MESDVIKMKKTIFVFLVAALFIGTTLAGASVLNKTDGKPEISAQNKNYVLIEVECCVDADVPFWIAWAGHVNADDMDTTITIKNTETNEEIILTEDADTGEDYFCQIYRPNLNDGNYDVTCHIDIPQKVLVVKENNLEGKLNLTGGKHHGAVYFYFDAGFGIKPHTKNLNFVSIIDNSPVIRHLLQRLSAFQ